MILSNVILRLLGLLIGFIDTAVFSDDRQNKSDQLFTVDRLWLAHYLCFIFKRFLMVLEFKISNETNNTIEKHVILHMSDFEPAILI